MLISEAEKHSAMGPPYRAKDMAYSSAPPIPLDKEQGSPKAIQKRVDFDQSNALRKA